MHIAFIALYKVFSMAS